MAFPLSEASWGSLDKLGHTRAPYQASFTNEKVIQGLWKSGAPVGFKEHTLPWLLGSGERPTRCSRQASASIYVLTEP